MVDEKETERLFFPQHGAECVAKSISQPDTDRAPQWEPAVGVAVEPGIASVVQETGFSRMALQGDGNRSTVYGPAVGDVSNYNQKSRHEGEPFEADLKGTDLQFSDSALAALSHFHTDQTGWLPLLGAADVFMVAQEHQFYFALRKDDVRYLDYGINWQVFEGDAGNVPGIWAFFMLGHMPQRVDLPETESRIFTIDAADLAQDLFN